jgi:energy-coupling factor transporter ATP-binding protein EcfA2
MSTATRTNTQSPALRGADNHDLIRVHGARENNLKDVSIEIPKRRPTVFTGVSGSGKSSLVFDTIASESQRLINETYSAFVQGFMPSLARPEVDLLEGLTTAISVDQQRMGAAIPGYTPGGWHYRLYSASGFVDPDKPIRKYTKKELHDLLHREPTRMKIAGINMTYEGLMIQKSMLSKDRRRCSRTSGRSSIERSRSRPVPIAAARGSARPPARRRSTGSTSPRRARCRSATSPSGSVTSTSRQRPDRVRRHTRRPRHRVGGSPVPHRRAPRGLRRRLSEPSRRRRAPLLAWK